MRMLLSGARAQRLSADAGADRGIRFTGSWLEPSEDPAAELRIWVGEEIGALARPELIQFAPALPKTRSGKIMRRILRKIAENDPDNLGDTTTLAEPEVVAELVEGRLNQ